MTNSVKMDNVELLKHLKSSNSEFTRAVCFEAGERKLLEAIPYLVQHLQSANLGIQEAAEAALRAIRGAEVVDRLIPLLRIEHVPVRNAAMDILREIASDNVLSLIKLLQDEDVDIRIFAADILGSSNSMQGMIALGESLTSDAAVNVRQQAASSLGSLGFIEAAEVLRLALKDEEEWVQFSAIESLASIKDDSCVDILIESLDSVSPLVAFTIIDALGEMDNVKAAPILLDRLDDLEGPLRNKAIEAILQILGTSSLSYLGEEALERFRFYLIDALYDAGNDFPIILEGLAELASPEGAEAVLQYAKKMDLVRDADKVNLIVDCLAKIGNVAVLAKGLKSKEPSLVVCSIEACGIIGGQDCVKALYKAFWRMEIEEQRLAMEKISEHADASFTNDAIDIIDRHSDSQVIKSVLFFLGQKARAKNTANTLFAYLEHPLDDVKEAALNACLGLQDKSMNDRLARLAQDENLMKCIMGIYAMGELDPLHYFADLVSMLSESEASIRKMALQSILRPEELTQKHLEILEKCLEDENRDVRLMATENLCRFPYEEILHHIKKALKDADPWVRIRAAEGFEFFHDVEAVPLLVEVLQNEEVLVQIEIIKVLGILGGDLAFHTLLGLAGHDEPEIAHSASLALDYMRGDIGELS